MNEIESSHRAPAMVALIIVMAGISGCTSLEAPVEAGPTIQSKSSRQQLLYQQSVEQGKSIETATEASLGGASDPNWGPLPLNIRW